MIRHIVAWVVLSVQLAQAQSFLGGGAPPITYPLDGLPAPSICYSTKRLLASYTANKVLDVTLSGTTQTIGFVNGVVDAASANAFCGGSSVCYVTKWYDQCGSGSDAAQAASVNNPLWNAANNVSGLNSVVFDYDNVADTTRLQIPSASFRVNGGNPITVLAVGQLLRSLYSGWLFQDAGFNTRIAYAATAVNPVTCLTTCGPPNIGITGIGTSTTPAEVEPSIVGLQWQGGSATAFSNDQSSTFTAAAGTPVSGAWMGGSGGGGTNSASLDAVAFLVYSTYLNATQTAAIRAKLAASFGIQTTFQDVVVQDGDSFSTGKGSTFNNSYMRFALTGLKRPVRAYNNSIDGRTLAKLVTDFSSNIPSYYQSGYRTFIVHILAGANDIRGGAAVATIYANLQAYVNAVHALGSNAKVIVATNPVQCDIFNSGTFLPKLQSYNNMIIANWNIAQGSGGLGADGLDNLWADPTVGPNSYGSSTFCGSPNAYSVDGAHPTDLSDSIMGPIEATALNAILP